MLAPLTAALARLDYPGAKLDIKLILEAVDVETGSVARRLDLPAMSRSWSCRTSPAHQAKGAQLCAAARPRRISRHL
jgi:hypothetical protein